MNTDIYSIIRKVSGELYYKALTKIPTDIYKVISAALEEETSPRGKLILGIIKKNIEIAEKKGRLVCQDTGTPIYLVRISNMEIDMIRLQESIELGVREITKSKNLRPNMVHPLTRVNSGDNTGVNSPEIITEFVKDSDSYIKITAMPKGSGSENMSTIRMLSPSDGLDGIKRFVLGWIAEIGGKGCPPYIVGIGIGGSFDQAARLAKIAVFRPIDERHKDPEIRKLEEELLSEINSLDIGPMGLGGDIVALAVNIEYAYTHISSLPVAVNIQCWRSERATAIIDKKLNITYV